MSVAVFPDKIVLKHSTDARSAIESAIGSGGFDKITAGELVVGREKGIARLYTLDSDNRVITVAGSGGSVPYFSGGYLNATALLDTSHVLNVPTHEPGDLLIAILMWRGDGLPITAPAGWTLYGDYLTGTVSGSISHKLYVYTKTAAASEPASYTWTGTVAAKNCGSMVAVAYGGIDSVTEYLKSATGTAPIDVTCNERYLNIIAHTWVTGSASNELATMEGAGTRLLSFGGGNPTVSASMLVGHTTQSGTVSCSHETADTADGAGAIVISLKLLTGSGGGGTGDAHDVAMDGGDFDTGLTDDTTTIFDQFPISIDAHADVDTTTTPPTNGQALVWNGVDNWVPGTVSGGASSFADLTDGVTTQSGGTAFQLTVDAGQATRIGYFNPNSESAYTLTGMRTFTNGGCAYIGGASAADRTSLVMLPGGYSYFTKDPSTTPPTDYTIRIKTTASSGDDVRYRNAPTLGTGTGDLVIPTMGQVRSYADSVGGATNLNGLTDVAITTPANGQALVYNGATWVNSVVSTVGSIDDLTDVDTSTTGPTVDQVLAWNGTNWVPANQSGGGGGGGIGAARLTDNGTASSGALTLTGLGSSGLFHTVSSDLAAWIVFYGSAADRTADSGRAYATDPTPGSGVLAEAYVSAAGTVLFTPGTMYANNDTSETSALYLAVRDQAGAAVNATVTVSAYVSGGYTGVSGGTFGSG